MTRILITAFAIVLYAAPPASAWTGARPKAGSSDLWSGRYDLHQGGGRASGMQLRVRKGGILKIDSASSAFNGMDVKMKPRFGSSNGRSILIGWTGTAERYNKYNHATEQVEVSINLSPSRTTRPGLKDVQIRENILQSGRVIASSTLGGTTWRQSSRSKSTPTP